MILDSSAIVAIVLRAPGWESLAAKLGAGPVAGVGAPALVATDLVLTNKMGKHGRAMVSRFLHQSGVTVVPFGEDHWGGTPCRTARSLRRRRLQQDRPGPRLIAASKS